MLLWGEPRSCQTPAEADSLEGQPPRRQIAAARFLHFGILRPPPPALPGHTHQRREEARASHPRRRGQCGEGAGTAPEEAGPRAGSVWLSCSHALQPLRPSWWRRGDLHRAFPVLRKAADQSVPPTRSFISPALPASLCAKLSWRAEDGMCSEGTQLLRLRQTQRWLPARADPVGSSPWKQASSGPCSACLLPPQG